MNDEVNDLMVELRCWVMKSVGEIKFKPEKSEKTPKIPNIDHRSYHSAVNEIRSRTYVVIYCNP